MSAIRGNSFYKIVSSTSWQEAESIANSLGGNLAAINDENENIFILNQFSSATLDSSRGGLWIGLSADLDGNFSWSNGDTYNYSNFATGQGLITDYRPYIGNQSAVDGQYVHMLGNYSNQVGFTGESPGEWNDVPNDPTNDISWGAQYEINKGIAEIPLSYFSVSDLEVNEGDSGSITISRTGGTLSAQSLTVTSSNGTASNSDYSAVNTTISFASGETSKTITFNSTEDTSTENDETVTIVIEASSTDDIPAQITQGTATITILDDDPAATSSTSSSTSDSSDSSSSSTSSSSTTSTTTSSSESTSSSTSGSESSSDTTTDYLRTDYITADTWEAEVRINRDLSGSSDQEVIQAKQVQKDEYDSGFVGSIVRGTIDDDTIRGLAGFDRLYGKAGDDLIHGGNGRDIIDGGSGSDELHGDFGWNTFLDQQDGSKDLIAIKSDQHLSNFWYGKAGNSPNGEKADFIEGLDATDEIKIIGVFTPDISVVDNVTARGVTGIGIYAKGTLEAVYTGGNLSTSQIQNMTTGDGSTTAMNNQMWSYWGDTRFHLCRPRKEQG